jgi:hypothetical protein
VWCSRARILRWLWSAKFEAWGLEFFVKFGTWVLRGRYGSIAWDQEMRASVVHDFLEFRRAPSPFKFQSKRAQRCALFANSTPEESGVLTSTRPIQRHARVSYSSLIQTPACSSGIDGRFLRLRSRSLSGNTGPQPDRRPAWFCLIP